MENKPPSPSSPAFSFREPLYSCHPIKALLSRWCSNCRGRLHVWTVRTQAKAFPLVPPGSTAGVPIRDQNTQLAAASLPTSRTWQGQPLDSEQSPHAQWHLSGRARGMEKLRAGHGSECLYFSYKGKFHYTPI